MNQKKEEFRMKLSRIYQLMEKDGLDAVVIGRKDNFSWISCGGTAEVNIQSEFTVAVLVIAKDRLVMIAQRMDLQRVWNEQMDGLPEFELRPLRWDQLSPVEEAERLLAGKKYIGDLPMKNGNCDPGLFHNMHYPLMPTEVERYRKVALEAEQIYINVAADTRPGQTELEVAALFSRAFVASGFDIICQIIGSDERLAAYRHSVASHKKIEKLLMMAPAVKKYGLTMPITRMIYYGSQLPDDIAAHYDAVCHIEAATLSMCRPDVRFCDILALQIRLYEELGYPGEWEQHAQGGLTGYIINDPSKALDQNAAIVHNQSFNWYITAQGAKVEETVLSGEQGAELLSVSGQWPQKNYIYGNFSYMLPQVLLI